MVRGRGGLDLGCCSRVYDTDRDGAAATRGDGIGHRGEEFFIGELAERSEVSRDTIRYYESAGVLPEARRSGSGYRLYTGADVERLGFVEQAKTLGLTLSEISEVLRIVDEGCSPCPEVLELLRERLEETRRRIRQLEELESRLSEVLSRAGTIATDPAARLHCPIIEGSDGTREKT